MRITLAQMNPLVGDVEGNVSRALGVVEKALADRADLVVFPELYVTGYPPKDLVERPAFIEEAERSLGRLVEASLSFEPLGVIVGCPIPTGLSEGKGLFNSAVMISGGKIVFKQAKSLLPTYDVFDEARYFDPARNIETFLLKGESLGVTVCEDAWNDPELWQRVPYKKDPIEILARKRATILINISASPFTVGKEKLRFDLISNHAKRHQLPFVFVNQVGGNDELIFDGRSLLVDSSGAAWEVLPSFEEAVITVDTKERKKSFRYDFEEDVESVFKALVLGTRDYVRKCCFSRVVLGLSGGIDSAVTCVIAVRALGPENVLALSMPSPYSSKESVEDARKLSKNLGIQLEQVSISEVMAAYGRLLEEHFEGCKEDVTEENIQARIRGNLLMAFSNKFGFLPLSTGNKSELAVGYCTLYGDMSGGLAVISDVPKTFVYELAGYINRGGEVIPSRIIEKPPSAELKPGQKDQDALPPYDVLDRILTLYVDERKSLEEIIAEGFEKDTVSWVVETIKKNEYKRKQAPPGLKVTSKAFGSGRRMPIAARYRA